MKNDIIIFLAKYLVFFIALTGVAYWLTLNKTKKTRLAASIIIGAALAAIAAKIAGKLYYDPRPFVTHNLKPLVSHSADNGFPSEHTTFSMLVAAVLYLYNRKLGAALFLLTLLVGLGRIWARVHSPIDILAGIAFGGLAAAISYFVVAKYWPNPVNPRDPVNGKISK